MTLETIERIADAILFEGYMLYPYRPSALKNRQRWNFGTLYPRDFAVAQRPEEAWSCRAEILVEGSEQSAIDLRIRFLQLIADGRSEMEWDPGVVRSWTIHGITINTLLSGVKRELRGTEFDSTAEAGSAGDAAIAAVDLHAEQVADRAYRVSATVANITPMPAGDAASRRGALAWALTSAHLLLHVADGAFASILDPQMELTAATQSCKNRGVFPVLVGEPGARSDVLCSPIILYDYPQIAAESAGSFFDGTEIDEMLALRVLTLTDEEKREMRASDPRAEQILKRTESLPREQLLKLHGALHGGGAKREQMDGAIRPWDPFAEKPAPKSVRALGVELRKGDRVRLRPRKRADILDMAMNGRTAVVEAIEQDLEDNVQLAVVLDDDPGKDLGLLRQPGHRFFFSVDEVEPVNLDNVTFDNVNHLEPHESADFSVTQREAETR